MIETIADLIVSGDNTFNVNKLSEYLDIEADNTWRIGERIGKSILKRKSNAWILSTGKTNHQDVALLIEELFCRLCPVKDRMLKFLDEHTSVEVQFRIAVYVSKATPIINIQPELLSKILLLGATLDVDIITI